MMCRRRNSSPPKTTSSLHLIMERKGKGTPSSSTTLRAKGREWKENLTCNKAEADEVQGAQQNMHLDLGEKDRREQTIYTHT